MIKGKILFIEPKGIHEGQPSHERISAFKKFYKAEGFQIESNYLPTNFKDFTNLKKSINDKTDYLFISMPPFRGWYLFFLFYKKIILDIRDGWSIGIQRGYGGSSDPNKIKAYIAKMIEKICIRLSLFTITCTPGLKMHLEHVSNTPILTILNGVSRYNYELVKKDIKPRKKPSKNKNFLKFVCAGKFSEYGRDKIKLVLRKILSQFPNHFIEIRIIGASMLENVWVNSYLLSQGINNINIVMMNRMNKDEMYKEICSADIGITILRDPDYEFGTKVFDYILCDVPIFNYFEDENNFTCFFKPYLYGSLKEQRHESKYFLREKILNNKKYELLKKLI